MNMKDLVPDFDEDDDEATKIEKVSAAIAAMMGGSAKDYALQQMSDGVYMMVFQGDPQELPDLAAALGHFENIPGDPLNIFDETASGMVH